MEQNSLRLGIDWGGTFVKLALVDDRGEIEDRALVETVGRPPEIVSAIKKAVAPWLKQGLQGTGVGVAGDVDSTRGIIRFSPNLGWKNIHLKSLFQRTGFPQPIRIDNDATAAAWGAYHLDLKGQSKNFILLTLGTGVGGGLVLDGHLYRGSTGTAGELGHVCVDPAGPLCACGARGCLEAFVGNRHLVQWASNEWRRRGEKIPPTLSTQTLNEMARRGDPVALRAWVRMGQALGIGVAGFINGFNPDTVLFTGGVAAAGPLFMPSLRREVARRTYVTSRRAARIRISSHNNDLGVVGAALLL
jgi:glucokinase